MKNDFDNQIKILYKNPLALFLGFYFSFCCFYVPNSILKKTNMFIEIEEQKTEIQHLRFENEKLKNKIDFKN